MRVGKYFVCENIEFTTFFLQGDAIYSYFKNIRVHLVERNLINYLILFHCLVFGLILLNTDRPIQVSKK